MTGLLITLGLWLYVGLPLLALATVGLVWLWCLCMMPFVALESFLTSFVAPYALWVNRHLDPPLQALQGWLPRWPFALSPRLTGAIIGAVLLLVAALW